MTSSERNRSRALAPWIAAVVIAAVVVSALIATVVGGANNSKGVRPETGRVVANQVSCPSLARGQSALATGDDAAVRAAIVKARSKALWALQSSDARFGRAERIALTMGSRSPKPPFAEQTQGWIEKKLTEAEQACGSRWIS
jgi:hypothetical protein